MRGGVVLVDTNMPANDAFCHFIRNCPSVRILTDTSRSSLTLHFWGCPPAQSPYRHTRVSHAFRPTSNDRRVTQCIVKLVLLHPTRQQVVNWRPFLMSNHLFDRTDFMLETAQSIVNEVNVQHEIYTRSLFPVEGVAVSPPQCYFSPICPAIINYSTNVNLLSLEWLRDNIMNKLHERVPFPSPGEDPAISARRHDRQILIDYFTAAQTFMPDGGGLGIITMELMSGCITLHSYLGQPGRTAEQQQFMVDLAHLQMIRLGAMGISHADIHPCNVMVNTAVRYLPDPHPLGNAFLIDFGATRRIQPTWDIGTIMSNYTCHIDAGFPGRANTLMHAMHQYNRHFLDHVRHQIVPSVNAATVDDFIVFVMQALRARLGNVAPQLGGRASIDKFSNKKITLDEFIDMIMDDMKPPVKFDLRGTPHKSPLNKSRRSQTPKKSPKKSPNKSPLNKSRRSQTPKKTPNNIT